MIKSPMFRNVKKTWVEQNQLKKYNESWRAIIYPRTEAGLT